MGVIAVVGCNLYSWQISYSSDAQKMLYFLWFKLMQLFAVTLGIFCLCCHSKQLTKFLQKYDHLNWTKNSIFGTEDSADLPVILCIKNWDPIFVLMNLVNISVKSVSFYFGVCINVADLEFLAQTVLCLFNVHSGHNIRSHRVSMQYMHIYVTLLSVFAVLQRTIY